MPADPLTDGVFRWLPLAFVVFGLYFLGSGLKILADSRRRQRTWVRRTGRVTGSRLSDGAIRFRVTFVGDDGQPVTFWNRFTTQGLDPVGRVVDVLSNPADPTDAVVVKGASLAGVAFVVAGALFTAVGLVVLS